MDFLVITSLAGYTVKWGAVQIIRSLLKVKNMTHLLILILFLALIFAGINLFVEIQLLKKYGKSFFYFVYTTFCLNMEIGKDLLINYLSGNMNISELLIGKITAIADVISFLLLFSAAGVLFYAISASPRRRKNVVIFIIASFILFISIKMISKIFAVKVVIGTKVFFLVVMFFVVSLLFFKTATHSLESNIPNQKRYNLFLLGMILLLMFSTVSLNRALNILIFSVAMMFFNGLGVFFMNGKLSTVSNYNEEIKISGEIITTYALTRREVEIINLIAQRLSNKEIAARLNISEGTVKNHNYNIFQKTQVKSRVELLGLLNTNTD
jgi:DNA-binding CsgD family transcriptional regulator